MFQHQVLPSNHIKHVAARSAFKLQCTIESTIFFARRLLTSHFEQVTGRSHENIPYKFQALVETANQNHYQTKTIIIKFRELVKFELVSHYRHVLPQYHVTRLLNSTK